MEEIKLGEFKVAEYQSATIGKLALALSKAQGKIQGAVKDSENPYFKSSYADLQSVWDACREALSQNELAVIQTTEKNDASVILITTLAHSSGEWIKGCLALKPIKNDPQSFGSALTYARRYALSAIVGVAPIEDDGEGAMGREAQKLDLSHDKSSPNTNPLTPSQKLPTEEKKGQNEDKKGIEKPLIEKIGDMLMMMTEGNKDEASKLLEKITTSERYAGKKSLKELTEKQIPVVYGKVKKAFEEWQKSFTAKEEKTFKEELDEEGEKMEEERETRANLISQIETIREELGIDEETYQNILTNIVEIEEWELDICPLEKLQKAVEYFEILKKERENG